MLPFSIESALSLVPSAETISPTEVHYDLAPSITSGVEIIDGTTNPVIGVTHRYGKVALKKNFCIII